jgi:hypothetical protein
MHFCSKLEQFGLLDLGPIGRDGAMRHNLLKPKTKAGEDVDE